MDPVEPEAEISYQDDAPPCGYKEMTVHMIFNTKLDDGFTRKAISI